MSLESCGDCALFEFRKNQSDLKKRLLVKVEQSLDETDPVMGILKIAAAVSGVGDRRCSAGEPALGASHCDRPVEYRPRR